MIALGTTAATTVYVARVFSPEVLGDFAVMAVLLPLVEILVAAGMTHVVAQRVAEGRDDGSPLDSVAGVVLSRLAIAALLVGISEALLPFLPLSPRLATYLRISEVAWIAVAADLDWLFVAVGRLDASAMVRGLSALLRLAAIVLLVRSEADALRLPWAVSLSALVTAAVAWSIAIGNGTATVVARRSGAMLAIAPRAAAGAHFFLGDLAAYGLTQADRFLIYALAGPTVTGLYHAAQRLVQPLYSVASVVTSAYYRRLVAGHAAGATASLRATLDEYFWWMLVATAPVGAFTTLFASEITSLAYGERYATCAPILAVFGWVITFGYTNGVLVLPFRAWRMPQAYSRTVGAAAATDLVLCACLVPLWGGVGGALAAVAGKLTATAVGWRWFRRASAFPVARVWAGFAASTLLATAAGALAHRLLTPAGGMAAFVAAYVTAELIRRRRERPGESAP